MYDEQINILTIFPPPFFSSPDKNLLRRLESISPGIRAGDVSDLFAPNKRDETSVQKTLDRFLMDADIIFGIALPPRLFQRAPRLKWIQIAAAGVEDFLTSEVINSDVIITNSKGMHATQCGELVLTMLLMLAKRANFLFENKSKKTYRKYIPTILAGKTLGIIGLGNIGCEVARLAKSFKMRVIGTRHHPEIGCTYADEVLPHRDLLKVLGQSDFVVLALPFTQENRGMIGEPELRAMKPSAFLINIARGAIVDEPALVRALEEGGIAGAGLDVFDVEPLPVGSKLWDHPNTILSPHIGGAREDYLELAVEIFCANLRLFLNGKKLKNTVNKTRGY